jgi:CSLREA domain-containing protein
MTRSTRHNLLEITALLALAATTLLTSTAPAHAAVYTVTKTADSADGACDTDCSLREAVLAADAQAGPDFILLGPGTYGLSLAGAGEDGGASGDLDVNDDVAIVGAAAASTILDGLHLDRVLDVHAGEVEIQAVTIRNGRVAGAGGGVRNQAALTLSRSIITANETTQDGFGGGLSTDGDGSGLTLTQSTVSGNTADGGGGGIADGGLMRVSDSTISGNRSLTDFGGGLYVFANTDAVLTNVTITGNTAALKGGGIFAEGSPFTGVNHPDVRDSILAGNSASSERDCSGAVRSGGYNLLGDGFDCIDFTAAHHDLVGTTAAPLDPRLGPLSGNNGGPTPTHALLAGSPAINAGNACTAADQRGQTRPATGCDIGAFEVGTACVNGGPILCLNNQRFRITSQWRTPQGASGPGQGTRLTADSGFFWFFDPANIELTAKVLNGCGVNDRYWVFLSGLTNVEVTVTVTDTQTGATKTYTSPQGAVFRTRLDTAAFASCH